MGLANGLREVHHFSEGAGVQPLGALRILPGS